MNRADYENAGKLVNDIDVLNEIIETQDKQHWVGFVCAEEPKTVLDTYSDTFYTDFKIFIKQEIEKLRTEFEKL